mgnify:CR=1 FL=1
MKKIVSVVGARPQFVKAAVLRNLFDASADFSEYLIHTGQHYDHMMSDIFFEELGIRAPDHKMQLENRGHGSMTGEMLAGIEEVLLSEKPDACLVYGDTNSTVAGALAAAKLHIPVIHVEAGLRSFNKLMPEEINRVLTDHVSDLLFCSTSESIVNLRNENITSGVHHTGDIMYDAVLLVKKQTESITHVAGIELAKEDYAACTLHRAENTDDKDRLTAILDFLNRHCEERDIILPVHPRTKSAVESFGLDFGKIRTIEPVSYFEMQALLAGSKAVFTDSGGLQKEAYFHRKPCVTMRDETEWVETIECGWNRLWTSDDYLERKPIEEYGNGESGKKMVELIAEHLGRAG